MRRAAIIILAAASLVTGPPTAAAAVTSVFTAEADGAQGTLRVAGDDADDTILVACGRDGVLVNGAPPDSGPLECLRANRIEVAGGAGDDRIDLDAIAPAQAYGTFRGVAAYGLVEGGPGDDAIVGPSDGLVRIVGGSGSDRMEGRAIDTYVFAAADEREEDAIVEPVHSRCEPSYVDSNQPGLSYWTVPWDALDFRLVAMDDPVTVDQRAPAGILATHRNRTVRMQPTSGGVAIEAIAGGAGNDRIAAACMALGASGDDSLRGTGSDGDLLLGGDGDDELSGGGGADMLDGGPGRDELDGGPGPDALAGGPGNDVLRGGRADDVYLLSAHGDAEADLVGEAAGAGIDVLSFDLRRNVPVRVDLATRSPVVARARGIEVRVEPGAARYVEGVIGGRGDDRVLGNDGANHFWSGGGTDLVVGRRGNDVYHVDWTGSMPYGAYDWGEVWFGPFERGAETGRSVWTIRDIPRSILRILEAGGGGLDTVSLAERFVSGSLSGARLEGQASGLRIDLSAPRWIVRVARVGALAARAFGGRRLEGARGTIGDDVLVGNAADNVLEGRQGHDRVTGGPGTDRCLVTRDGDVLRGCERVRQASPDR
jgi:Ca2+-binding RTX toxin-like protein